MYQLMSLKQGKPRQISKGLSYFLNKKGEMDMNDKEYLMTQIMGRNEFEEDVKKWVKPTYPLYFEELMEKISEDIKYLDIKGTQTIRHLIEEEKTLTHNRVVFKFEVTDEDLILSIRYIGYDES